MHNARKTIEGIAVRVRPLVRLADGSCMSVTTTSAKTTSAKIWGPNFQLGSGLNRKTRV